jgi:hypothetical protein
MASVVAGGADCIGVNQAANMAQVWATVVWLEKQISGSATKICKSQFETEFLLTNDCDGSEHVWQKLGVSKHAGNFKMSSEKLVDVRPEEAGTDDRKAFRVFHKTLYCTTCRCRFVFEMLRSQRKGEGKINTTSHSKSHHVLINCARPSSLEIYFLQLQS